MNRCVEIKASPLYIYFNFNDRYKQSGLLKNSIKLIRKKSLSFKKGYEQLARKELQAVLGKVKRVECTVSICGNEKMKSYNTAYRKIGKTTDVLSFPVFDSLRKGKPKVDQNNMDLFLLGDIIINKDRTQAQAISNEVSFQQEFLHLFVHGFLHLMGFDHELSKREEIKMFDLERFLLKQLL